MNYFTKIFPLNEDFSIMVGSANFSNQVISTIIFMITVWQISHDPSTLRNLGDHQQQPPSTQLPWFSKAFKHFLPQCTHGVSCCLWHSPCWFFMLAIYLIKRFCVGEVGGGRNSFPFLIFFPIKQSRPLLLVSLSSDLIWLIGLKEKNFHT